MRNRYALTGAVLALAVGGCVSIGDETPAAGSGAIAPAAFERERLVGRWGVASFHDEKDRRRTEAEARAQCSQAYAISKGPTDRFGPGRSFACKFRMDRRITVHARPRDSPAAA